VGYKNKLTDAGGVFGSKGNLLIILIMILGVFVAILNETLLNVALTKIMQDLGVSPSTVQWLTTGYLLVIGVLIPVTAFLIQRFTTRTLFLAAMGLFTAGTFMAAVAPGFEVLLIGRLIQASGTGMLFPLLTNVVLAIVPIHNRGAAMGMIGTVITFAPAIGPTLSGLVVEHFSWRVLFYGVLPIALAVIVFASVKLANVTQNSNPKVDLLSVLLSTLGFGGIVYGFSSAGESHAGWLSPEVLLPVTVGTCSLALFVWRQLSMQQPMLDLRAFQYDMFRLSVLINMIVMMAMFSAMMLLPIFLQDALGYRPLDAGLIMLPGGIIMGIMSPVTGRIFDKFGAKWLSVVGLGLMAVTLCGFAFITSSTSYVTVMVLNSLFMLGISIQMMPVMTNGLNQLPRRLYPHGTAISGTLQQVAGAVGTALLVTVMAASSNRYLQNTAGTADSGQVIEAMTFGMKNAFLLALAFVMTGWFAALFWLKRSYPPESEQETVRLAAH
jgi:DHA2 family lincomycin resistance protein-like MFS transporter